MNFENRPKYIIFLHVFKYSNENLRLRLFMYLKFPAGAANAKLSKTQNCIAFISSR